MRACQESMAVCGSFNQAGEVSLFVIKTDTRDNCKRFLKGKKHVPHANACSGCRVIVDKPIRLTLSVREITGVIYADCSFVA